MISSELKLTLLIYLLTILYLGVNYKEELQEHAKLIPIFAVIIYYGVRTYVPQ